MITTVYLVHEAGGIVNIFAEEAHAKAVCDKLGPGLYIEERKVIYGKNICADCEKLTFESEFVCPSCFQKRQGSS